MKHVVILTFPGVEELDFVGPYEAFSMAEAIRPESCRVELVAKTADPIAARHGLRFFPDRAFDGCPEADILIVPGGAGRLKAMKDPEILSFVRRIASSAEFVATVCTGAFIAAAAGLLEGRRATTHHSAFAELEAFGGVTLVRDRIVDAGDLPSPDGKAGCRILTAGGVSSGIDLALEIIRRIYGDESSALVRERMEYPECPSSFGGEGSVR
jgi:cyclohexyl-isocyanide hydratase